MSKFKINVHQYFSIYFHVWIKLLFRNRGVHHTKWLKGIVITLTSAISFPLQLVEWLYIRYKLTKQTPNEDPIFIIGHWRSGTTFLHYLMAKDPKYGYLTYYQAFLPTISVSGKFFLKSLIKLLMPGKRPQDNMEVAMDLPFEEENSLADMAIESASHSFFFPQNESYFRKYALLDDLSDGEYKRWKKSYKSWLDKIAIMNNYKPLLVKNPHNTGRIRGLLDIYPNAKFIHIYRNPLDVIPSTILMYDLVVQTQFLQKLTEKELLDKIFYYYRATMQNLLKDIALIPEKQLYSIKFEDFQFNSIQIIQDMYQHFGLKYSNKVSENVRKYAESKRNYKKNKHHLNDDLKKRIESECAFSFEKFGYDI